ncbi:MAG: hypothetical protein GYA32_17655 [Serratia sp.]|nr:hypothetical protein [Serratia sp. (in: enterobacteria)]
MSAKEMLAEIKQRGLIKAGNIQDELNALAVSQEEEIISLNQQLSAKTISEQSIINAFGISGEGAHRKLVIEYVHGVVAENVAMRGAIEFAEPWLPSCDDELLHIISQAKITPATDAAIAEIKAQGADTVADYHKVRVDALIDVDRKGANEHKVSYMAARDVAANLRAGRKG